MRAKNTLIAAIAAAILLGSLSPSRADESADNAFKVQWEMFLRHVAGEGIFRWGLLEGAKGVQLAEKGLESWQRRAWVDLPPLRA